jgi:hypothetical protein
MAPRSGWEEPQNPDPVAASELLRMLRPHATSSAELDVPGRPEIFAGVGFLMPLSEALEKLGLAWAAVPARIPIPHPSIPFFYRSFRFQPSPASPLFIESESAFDVLLLVTDGEDRVVAMQLGSESPKGNRKATSDFLTHNLVQNRRKAVTALKVGYQVTPSTDGILLETWVTDERREELRELARLYLPAQVARFLRHVAEQQLTRP